MRSYTDKKPGSCCSKFPYIFRAKCLRTMLCVEVENYLPIFRITYHTASLIPYLIPYPTSKLIALCLYREHVMNFHVRMTIPVYYESACYMKNMLTCQFDI